MRDAVTPLTAGVRLRPRPTGAPFARTQTRQRRKRQLRLRKGREAPGRPGSARVVLYRVLAAC